MYYSKKEREYYNAYRQAVCDKLHITKNNYNWLRRKANDWHRNDEQYCNGLISEDAYQLINHQILSDIRTYIKKFDLYIYHQSDPRGATLYIDTKQIPYDNYTQASYVY